MSERCFILTAEQASRDWSGSRKGTALRPIPLANGTEWVVPARAVERSAHAAHRDYLATLPLRDVEESDFNLAKV